MCCASRPTMLGNVCMQHLVCKKLGPCVSSTMHNTVSLQSDLKLSLSLIILLQLACELSTVFCAGLVSIQSAHATCMSGLHIKKSTISLGCDGWLRLASVTCAAKFIACCFSQVTCMQFKVRALR